MLPEPTFAALLAEAMARGRDKLTRCPYCDGTGYVMSSNPKSRSLKKCLVCDGEARVLTDDPYYLIRKESA